ncbi:MAG: winged helix-turn-helix domain-containing protein [Candidatus Omnitrophota bacterium]
MLEPLLGNGTIEKIFFFLETYGQGYPKGMSRTFGISVNGIQQQLQRLEDGGIVVSFLEGKTRLYRFNSRYPFLKEVKSLLRRAMEFLSEKEIERYYRKRTRPRKKGKPL